MPDRQIFTQCIAGRNYLYVVKTPLITCDTISKDGILLPFHVKNLTFISNVGSPNVAGQKYLLNVVQTHLIACGYVVINFPYP